MKSIKSTALLLCAALALSCSNLSVENAAEGTKITVSAGSESTKSLLGSSDLTAGTQVMLYDELEDGAWNIDGKTTTCNVAGDPWLIADEPAAGYSWVPDGKHIGHNFFGWLTQDKDGLSPASIFGSNPSLAKDSPSVGVNTLQLPQTAITLHTQQFDFAYSDLVNRDPSNANYSTVYLTLSHLFTAFGIKAHNYDSEAITIHSIKLFGLRNNKSATITFDKVNNASGAAFTTIGQIDNEGWELLDTTNPIVVGADETVENVITCAAGGNKPSNAQASFLMWPQTAAEMNGELERNGNGTAIADPSKASLVIEYSAGGGDHVTVPVALSPSSQAWDSGTRHNIELAFTSKFVMLTVNALPWDQTTSEIDYTGEVAGNEAGRLSFNPISCTVVEAEKKVYFKTGASIQCYFTILAPMDGTWMITKNGDFDAFEIDNAAEGTPRDGEDHAYGTIDGGQASIYITPKIEDPQKDYQINLSFAVRTNSGRVLNADEIVQGENSALYYTFILQAS